MNKVLLTVVLLHLVISTDTLVCAQTGSTSRQPNAVAKSATKEPAQGADSAETTAEKASGGDSVEAQKYYESGTSLFESGKIEESIAAFKQAAKIKPNDAQIHYMLGVAQSKAKAYKDSLESFKRAVRFKSDWPEAQFKLGVMSYVLGRKSESTEAYNTLLKLDSRLANDLYRIIKEDISQTTVTKSDDAGNSSLKRTEIVPTSAPVKEVSVPTVGESRTPLSSGGNSTSTTTKPTQPASAPAKSAAAKEISVPTVDESRTPLSSGGNSTGITTKPTQPASAPAKSAADKEISVPTVGESRAPLSSDANSTTTPAKPTPPTSDSATSSAASVADPQTLTGIYRIGVGDVLDIRLFNSSTPRSTLYTVVDGGLIDLPLVGGPIVVAGLTTDEIQTRIGSELKRRAIEEGVRVSVGVRQFASHSVVIMGLVSNPGPKFLRREAVPLYVLMAEAQARLDAGRVTIMRSGTAVTVDLADSNALNFLIRPGDMISVTARQQEFYYIAGRINYPGQKAFQPGLTLLQAVLAAGGVVRQGDNLVEISREGPDARLTTVTFKLKEIKTGKIQDPRVQPGDRIEVVR